MAHFSFARIKKYIFVDFERIFEIKIYRPSQVLNLFKNIFTNRYGFPLNLVSPSSVVSITFDGQIQIHVEADVSRFAIVQGL